MTRLYRELLTITRAVIRQAEAVGAAVAETTAIGVQALRDQLRETVGLVRRVVAQTRARVFKGDTHYPDKLLSLFEPHTEAIRKGKAAKPTEFGKVVLIQEAEAQFITTYTVLPTRVPDQELWVPAVQTHCALFGHAPRLAVADAGFASAANEEAATQLGVCQVALPRRGRAPRGHPPPRQRWFRRALRWRTGCEGRISVLKRRHGLRRCRYRGLRGMERWVGLGVIANDLLVLGRAGPPGRPRSR
jgi:IS5 family transposase